MLDLETLKTIPRGTIFARGKIIDSPDGINMTNSGKMLRWLAKKGYGYDDWCIYCHRAINDWDYVRSSGDKVINKHNIKKLVPCTDECFALYRY